MTDLAQAKTEAENRLTELKRLIGIAKLDSKDFDDEEIIAVDREIVVLAEAESEPIGQALRIEDLVRRPGVSASELVAAAESEPPEIDTEMIAAVEVEVKYAGYVERERNRAATLRTQAEVVLPDDLPYQDFVTLSYESREKLARIRPGSLAQAGRIPGISPADLQNLVMEVRKWRSGRTS